MTKLTTSIPAAAFPTMHGASFTSAEADAIERLASGLNDQANGILETFKDTARTICDTRNVDLIYELIREGRKTSESLSRLSLRFEALRAEAYR